MGFRQFTNSLQQIAANPHVSTTKGVARHLHWQVRRMFNLFPFRQRLAGSKIIAAHPRCAVSALIYSQGLYDYNNMRLVQWLLQDGGTFFDIGANIGAYTLLASEQGKAEVFAFEPHPQTFRLLAANVRINVRQNVHLFQVALSQHDGSVCLTDGYGSSVNHISRERHQGTVEVFSGRVESICDRYGVVPSVVKLDVEGHEFEVLSGFGPYLGRIDVLLIEMNGLSDERGAGIPAIHRLLTEARLRGPWRCGYDRFCLEPSGGAEREDSVYLSHSKLSALREAGWRVVEQA